MAGHLSHTGVVESGPYSLSQDKPEAVDRWYISRKDIEDNSPSRRDGIDLKKETYLRKSYCTFLQDLGMRLKVPQVTIATAIIFSHRFFLHQSHAKNDRRIIATVCMFLAGKVEETPRPLKDVILVSYEIINKKDPAAVQRIKQKEVYEQQKELILLGERVVLATLGFDFNINHPYKPLVEAIKKFKVAQNALAQVAWNFVNDGLRTSLCLQFKPHHIAAGAIFLAAKFLKVKLPSEGEKVWWQEFDVTPRQLEEVSNQMLELYEQNKVPASKGNEVEGTVGGGDTHQASVKPPAANKEPVSMKSNVQVGSGTSAKPGPVVPPGTQSGLDQSSADCQGGLLKISQSNEYGGTRARGDKVDHGLHNGLKDGRHPGREPLPYTNDNTGETSNRSKIGSEQLVKEDNEGNNGEKNANIKLDEWKNKNASCKFSSTSQNLEHRDPVGQSPQDAIKEIDKVKDKVKAAREKRRKSCTDVVRKMDFMDDDDLIERELEDGIEMAIKGEKINQEREQVSSKPSKCPDVENPSHRKDSKDSRDGDNMEVERHDTRGLNVDKVDGEVPLSGNAEQLQSPNSGSRKRKADSYPDDHLEGKQGHDYIPGYHYDPDITGDRMKITHLGFPERDHKRHVQENLV